MSSLSSEQSKARLNIISHSVDIDLTEKNNQPVISIISLKQVEDAVSAALGGLSKQHIKRIISKATFSPKPKNKELVMSWLDRAKNDGVEPSLYVSIENTLVNDLRPILEKVSHSKDSSPIASNIGVLIRINKSLEAEKLVLLKEIHDLKIEVQLNKDQVATLEEKVEGLEQSKEEFENFREQQKELKEQSILADLRRGIYQYFLYCNRENELIRPFVKEMATPQGGSEVVDFRMKPFYKELNDSGAIKRLIMEFYNAHNLDFLNDVREHVQTRDQASHPLESIEAWEFNFADFLDDAEIVINEMKFFKMEATLMLEQAKNVIRN